MPRFCFPVTLQAPSAKPTPGAKPIQWTRCVELRDFIEINRDYGPGDPPPPDPDFGLALSVQKLVDFARSFNHESEFTREIEKLSNIVFDRVRAELPAGVTLVTKTERKVKAA